MRYLADIQEKRTLFSNYSYTAAILSGKSGVFFEIM